MSSTVDLVIAVCGLGFWGTGGGGPGGLMKALEDSGHPSVGGSAMPLLGVLVLKSPSKCS